MRGSDAVAGALLRLVGPENRARPAQVPRVVSGLVTGAWAGISSLFRGIYSSFAGDVFHQCEDPARVAEGVAFDPVRAATQAGCVGVEPPKTLNAALKIGQSGQRSGQLTLPIQHLLRRWRPLAVTARSHAAARRMIPRNEEHPTGRHFGKDAVEPMPRRPDYSPPWRFFQNRSLTNASRGLSQFLEASKVRRAKRMCIGH